MTEIAAEIRYCEDIAMWSSDRSIKESCNWRTSFCKHCYNHKLAKVFKGIPGKDIRNEAYWAILDGERLKKDLSKKRKGDKSRFRFQTRGETFANPSDVLKVRDILLKNPETVFWIPTRAWRNVGMRDMIQVMIMSLPNARVQASMDPSNTAREWEVVKAAGWSTMFYGDNDMIRNPNGDLSHLCEKTFFGIKGACGDCKDGCFSKDRVDVHLKQH